MSRQLLGSPGRVDGRSAYANAAVDLLTPTRRERDGPGGSHEGGRDAEATIAELALQHGRIGREVPVRPELDPG